MLPVENSSRLTHIAWQGTPSQASADRGYSRGQPPVVSDQAAGAAADSLTGSLWVRFIDGTTGYYPNVPLDLFAQMRNSASKGQFLSQQIIDGGYPFQKSPLPDSTVSS
jgi:hypothetical protein